MDKTHVLLQTSSHIWLFPLAAYSDKWWRAVHSEVETCARAPCGGCAGWGGMNGGLVTPPPTYPNPHVPAPTSPPLAALTANITCSSPPHRIVSHIAHLLQLAGGLVDGVSVVWWLGRGAGSGQPGPHHQALSTGVSAREVERVSGGRLSTRRGGHRGNRQNILQGRDFDMAGLRDWC